MPMCDGKNLMGTMVVDVILAAICADMIRDLFHDKGHSVAIKGDGCCALTGIPVLTDDALHQSSRLFIGVYKILTGNFYLRTDDPQC
jgi:hypothetical protein